MNISATIGIGNPLKYPKDKINKRIGITYGELYSKTLERFELIKATRS